MENQVCQPLATREAPEIPDAIADLVLARAHGQLALQHGREPLDHLPVMPGLVHMVGLVHVLADPDLQGLLHLPESHECVQVVHSLIEAYAEHVQLPDDSDNIGHDPSPRQTCEEHRNRHGDGLDMVDRRNISESHGGENNYAKVQSQPVSLARCEVLDWLLLCQMCSGQPAIALLADGIHFGFKAEVCPDAGKPMQEHQRNEKAAHDAHECEGEAVLRVASDEELQHPHEPEHPQKPDDSDHPHRGGILAREDALPGQHRDQIGPEPTGIEVVRERHCHVVPGDFQRLSNPLALMESASGEGEVERQHHVDYEHCVDTQVKGRQPWRRRAHQCDLVGHHERSREEGDNHQNIPQVDERVAIWNDGEVPKPPPVHTRRRLILVAPRVERHILGLVDLHKGHGLMAILLRSRHGACPNSELSRSPPMPIKPALQSGQATPSNHKSLHSVAVHVSADGIRPRPGTPELLLSPSRKPAHEHARALDANN
mmetsp:Transcript_64988/g.210512  ORF Transcript_64988/g.210512 Transcript_64988/m.210512 type:complete len:486 (-) Transcript_64988:27-1484(-)